MFIILFLKNRYLNQVINKVYLRSIYEQVKFILIYYQNIHKIFRVKKFFGPIKFSY